MPTETSTIPASSTGPTLEEEAAALDSGKETETPPLAGETVEETPERPEWLPEKFNSVEDMAKAYAELEKKNSSPDDAGTDKPSADDAEKAADSAGLDMDALRAEYADKGELSAGSLAALEKQGITKDMVDMYVAGQAAQAEAVRSSILEPVGGEEAYNDMVAWAADNLSDGDIDTFNKVLEGGDTASIKMAVENLHGKFKEANGSEPSVQLSGKPSAGSSTVYESTADLMKDMQNPEYASNPAFRAKVEQKLARSNIM